MSDLCPACDRREDALRALARQGERQTSLRRDVLDALHHAGKPVGAYDLFDLLKAGGRASAPPAVYRVLDFLVGQGLVHKLHSQSVYAACLDAAHAHDCCFLTCESCGSITEITHAATAELLASLHAGGARPRHLTIEAEGLCPQCAR